MSVDGVLAGSIRLRLFVAGNSARSRHLIQEIKGLLQMHSADLEVVDIYQQPELAEADHVVAAPTLLRISPLPARRLVGDVSGPRVLSLLAEPGRISHGN